ncbi:hypothetical protein CsSME_00035749 [Camellia sinensis var. sinensis]|uniref:Uncharacterized protein n=1 Tax=Camellia sinensis TaxID=4442 RepID=A0A7J7GTN1_CAMSI|nr:hypothetical protein HYC85_020440 [Camellia sinensis]
MLWTPLAKVLGPQSGVKFNKTNKSSTNSPKQAKQEENVEECSTIFLPTKDKSFSSMAMG